MLVFKKMITDGAITVNNEVKRANYKLKANDQITMVFEPPTEIEVKTRKHFHLIFSMKITILSSSIKLVVW